MSSYVLNGIQLWALVQQLANEKRLLTEDDLALWSSSREEKLQSAVPTTQHWVNRLTITSLTHTNHGTTWVVVLSCPARR